MNEHAVSRAGPPRIIMPAPEAAAKLLHDPALIRVFDALDQGADETRIVGGALRDALSGWPVHEIDLATTATPQVVIERANAAHLRTVPTGLDHGTVTLIVDHRSFEVTSLREDIETDGRRAKVRFGRNFEMDALRRDFTMNALFLARDGQLFDFVGGLADIEARRVRFIGEPAQRIQEDYLRILRFFRFSAEFGEGALDRAGFLASIREREGLCRLSRERIRAELFKLLCAKRAGEIIAEMSDAGLLGPLLASAPNPGRLLRAASIIGGSRLSDPMLGLAALCVYVQEDAERLRERLRLSKAEFQRLERISLAQVTLHGRDMPPERKELLALLYHFGREAALDAFALAQTGACALDFESWKRARAFLHESQIPYLPVSGAHVIARGVTAGRAVGTVLKVLETRWIAAGFPQDTESLQQMLDDMLGRSS